MLQKFIGYIKRINIINKIFDDLIWSLLIIYSLIDIINGYLERSFSMTTNLSIAQFYKTILFIIILLRLFNTSYHYKIKIYVYGIIVYFISVIFVQDTTFSYGYTYDIIKTSKIIFIIVDIVYFYIYYSETKDINRAIKIIYINYIYIIVNFIIGLLGFGYSTYIGGLGIKGYFYAGNELAILLVVLSSFIIYRSYKNNFKLYLVSIVVSLLMAILLAMKTSILGILLIGLLIPVIVRIKSWYGILKIFKYSILILFISICSVYMLYQVLGSESVIGRWVYFLQKYGLITGLLSSRNITFTKANNIFYKSNSILWAFFGIGFQGLIKNAGKLIEIDILDLFFSYGVIGLIIIYGSWFYVVIILFINSFVDKTNYEYSKFVLLLNVVLILISMTTGHVIYSASAGIYIALISSMGFISNNNSLFIYEKKNNISK